MLFLEIGILYDSFDEAILQAEVGLMESQLRNGEHYARTGTNDLRHVGRQRAA
jgi:hypothetical protein